MRIPDEVANAAKKADLDAVKAWLAQQTANIDKHRDKYGWTLLHLSCLDELTADHIALAEYLLSCGANIDRCGKAHNGPALHLEGVPRRADEPVARVRARAAQGRPPPPLARRPRARDDGRSCFQGTVCQSERDRVARA